jgi:hypothetical protein
MEAAMRGYGGVMDLTPSMFLTHSNREFSGEIDEEVPL